MHCILLFLGIPCYFSLILQKHSCLGDESKLKLYWRVHEHVFSHLSLCSLWPFNESLTSPNTSILSFQTRDTGLALSSYVLPKSWSGVSSLFFFFSFSGPGPIFTSFGRLSSQIIVQDCGHFLVSPKMCVSFLFLYSCWLVSEKRIRLGQLQYQLKILQYLKLEISTFKYGQCPLKF